MYYTPDRFEELDAADPKYQRGSCIGFAIVNDVKYFLFGIDKETGEIGILGGSRQKRDGDIFATANREYNEETLKVLTKLSIKSVVMGGYIYSEKHNKGDKSFLVKECILFIYYAFTTMDELYAVVEEHNTKVGELIAKSQKIEISGLVWIDEFALTKAFDVKGPVIIQFTDGQRFPLWKKTKKQLKHFKTRILPKL